MRKSLIKVGVVYRNKSGNSARKVLSVASLTAVMQKQDSCYRWLNIGQTVVMFDQERGPGRDTRSAVTLEGFAAWAHSEDDGMCDAQRIQKALAAADHLASLVSTMPLVPPGIGNAIDIYQAARKEVR